MALSQRSAARFFAAFYRWKCYTLRKTTHLNHAQHRRTAWSPHSPIHTTRCYSASSRYLTPVDSLSSWKEQESAVRELEDSDELPKKGVRIRRLTSKMAPHTSREDHLVDSLSSWKEQESAVRELEDSHELPEKEVRIERLTSKIAPHTSRKDYLKAESLPGVVRTIMRHVPSSVVIITATHQDTKSNEAVPLGIAVSSFNTVSLNPPHISFNIKCPSKTLDAIRSAKGLFRVHLLSDTDESSRIASTFSNGNTEETYLLRKESVPMLIPKSREVAEATESAAPQIQGSSVVAALECELTQELPVADHIIAVAKVNTVATKPKLRATLLYHDGAYKRVDSGTALDDEHQNTTVTLDPELGMYWKYPLFPGKAEQDHFKKSLKSYLHRNAHFFEMGPYEADGKLRKNLGIPSDAFGIDLTQLVEQCRVEAGYSPRIRGDDAPVEAPLYGRLSTHDVANIVEQARKLVVNSPLALDLPYQEFFRHLGLYHVSFGLLAGDIMERLRSEGLVAPFEPNTILSVDTTRYPTIEQLEHVEFQLRRSFELQSYQEVVKLPMKQSSIQLCVSERAKRWCVRARTRLIVEAFPDVFNAPHIDIKGELTSAEVRVFVNRVIQFLAVHDRPTMERHLAIPRMELMRRVGVHPLISGVDPEYLFGKLEFLMFQKSGDWRAISQGIDEMLAPMFKNKNFQKHQLQARVRHFVRIHPVHAVSWSRQDILAAMGIDERATVRSSATLINEPLTRSGTLSELMVNELDAYSPHATPAEKVAIDDWLFRAKGTPDVFVPAERDGGRRIAGVGLDGKNIGMPGWGRKGRLRRQLVEREGWNRGARKGARKDVEKNDDDGSVRKEEEKRDVVREYPSFSENENHSED